MKRLVCALPTLVLLGAAPPPGGAPLRLVLPIACTPGRDCAVQNYPDDDPGPGVRDYACHARTYPGHDGTDIRLPSMARQRAGVVVLAAAAGTVLRVRDGVIDRSVREAPATPGQECGNGVVIDHGGGWETQTCHMARGSVAVHAGQKVAAGTVLGRVGLSGDTEFPHVHLTVRKDGASVDPFAWRAPVGACRAGQSLWATPIAYREGQVLVAGFASGAVTMAAVQDAGAEQQPRPDRTTPLVAFVQAIGLAGGDVQHLVLRGADGAVLADNQAAPLERDKAQVLLFAGHKAPPGGWPAGTYRATYSVARGGKAVINSTAEIRL